MCTSPSGFSCAKPAFVPATRPKRQNRNYQGRLAPHLPSRLTVFAPHIDSHNWHLRLFRAPSGPLRPPKHPQIQNPKPASASTRSVDLNGGSSSDADSRNNRPPVNPLLSLFYLYDVFPDTGTFPSLRRTGRLPRPTPPSTTPPRTIAITLRRLETENSMARLYPFHALRYDPARVHMEAVVTQPYDKITPAMQQRYYEASPYNLVRVILGKQEPGDTEPSGVPPVRRKGSQRLHPRRPVPPRLAKRGHPRRRT